MLWDPIRYAETCPSSDGACAMVLGQRVGRRSSRRTAPSAWIHGTAMRSEPTMSADRDTVLPARRAPTAPPTSTARPASPTPAGEVDCVEMYVPF